MPITVNCPSCGKDAKASGRVSCMCDKDNCLGQRCMANKLAFQYTCAHCGDEGTPPETQRYFEVHSK